MEVRRLLVRIGHHLHLLAEHLSVKTGVVKMALAVPFHIFGHASLKGAHRMGKLVGELAEVKLLHLNQRSEEKGREREGNAAVQADASINKVQSCSCSRLFNHKQMIIFR